MWQWRSGRAHWWLDPAQSYLRGDVIIQAGAGYGRAGDPSGLWLLSENPNFVDCGLAAGWVHRAFADCDSARWGSQGCSQGA